jgi:hypothetical protein
VVTFNFVVAPKDKVFKVIDGEIRAYIVKEISVFGSEGQCLYTLLSFNGHEHAHFHDYPAGMEVTEYDFGHTIFLTMEEAIDELRKQRKREKDSLCNNEW